MFKANMFKANIFKIMFILLSSLLLAYPFLVFFGLQYFEPRYIGLVAFFILIIRFLIAKRYLDLQRLRDIIPLTVVLGMTCLCIFLFNTPLLLRLNPVLINAVMFVMFSLTLFRPPSMIERFARIMDPGLPHAAIEYTRQVTFVWCYFFVFNGLVSLYTVFFCSMATWTYYNGFIAYIFMGILFSGEYLIRRYKMRDAR